MQQVTLEEAKTHLFDLIGAAAVGEDITITRDDELSVRLVPYPIRKRRRQFGSAKGLISMTPDFDSSLDDFKEYIE